MREKVQLVLDDTDGNVIRDSTSVLWKEFKWTNGYFKHKIFKVEIERPYLISQAYYGTVDYWDIILLLNNVEDIFEIIPLSELYIHKLEDIKQFVLDNRQ
jgi:hypothetical protein